MYVCESVQMSAGVSGGQKRTQDPWELELHTGGCELLDVEDGN